MPKKEYYIVSTKYSWKTRQTKSGTVYDVVFRIIDKQTLQEHQKRLCGFKTKAEAKAEKLARKHSEAEMKDQEKINRDAE